MLYVESVKEGKALEQVFASISYPYSFNKYSLRRIIDVVSSLMIFILFGWLYIIIGIIVKLSSKGNVIYSQERIGLNGVPFRIYKYRTMYPDAEKNGPALSEKNDVRVTPAGRILRKLHLDELPQFYNVLVGDMSIIGTRPEREFYIWKILEKAPEYKEILKNKPGITSWGQLKYGYATNIDEMIQRLDYDLYYINNKSLLMDIRIFFTTIFLVLFGKDKLLN